MSLTFGDERAGGPAKVAIGLATALLGVMALGLASAIGADRFAPLFVLVPLYALFVAWVLCRRRVDVVAARREVVVTRNLLGLRWRRQIGFGAFSGVECLGVWLRPKGGSPWAGTPEGDARFIKYEVSLRRRWRRLLLDHVEEVGDAEAVARQVARVVGVPAVRRDYVLRADGLPLRRRRARQGLG